MNLKLDDFLHESQGWTALLPQRPALKVFSGKRRVSWAVIGAGFTGLAAARRLAQLNPSDDIIMCDARALAQNASGRNSGFGVAISDFSGKFCRDQTGSYQRINRINQAGLSQLRQLVQSHQINCQWRQTGTYRAAADCRAIAGLEDHLRYLDALNVAYERLGTDDLSQRLGSSHYHCGFKIAHGALMQPAALVFGLADSLPPNIALFENSPVLQITRGSTVELQTPGGEITADKVVIATNYEAPRLGVTRARVLGSTLSGSVTQVLSDEDFAKLGTEPTWGLLSLHSGGATVRLTQDRRIAIRNTAEFHGGMLLSQHQLSRRRRLHRKAFDARFPQLAHVPFATSWSCVEGLSRNGTNFFGRQGETLYYAGGYNGSGISRGTAFGTALAEWAMGGHSQLIADCLASPAATWLPPRPILDVGAWFTVRKRFAGVGKDR